MNSAVVYSDIHVYIGLGAPKQRSFSCGLLRWGAINRGVLPVQCTPLR